MSRSKAKPKSSPAKSHEDSASISLPAQAAAALAAARHKEAIELYKSLLKREPSALARDGLAAAYAGRADALAAKDMFKEAAALWRTRAELCGTPLAEGSYISWLLRINEHQAALKLLSTLPPDTDAKTHVETQLAAAAFALPESALAILGAESPLRRYRPVAHAAWVAYLRGDTAALSTHLAAVSFRSPYRDLRPVLKALSLVSTDAVAAIDAIARVPDDSAFATLAAVVRVAACTDARWLFHLNTLSADAQQMVFDLKGCAQKIRPLLLNLARLGDTPTASELFKLLLRSKHYLPDGSAAQLCQRLLISVPEGLNNYHAVFGKLSLAESQHLHALSAEHKGNLTDTRVAWLHLAKTIQAEQPLKTALIFRHLAVPCATRDGQYNDIKALDCLAQSLILDPTDQDTYLKLIRAWRLRKDLKQARVPLDAALERFPTEVPILLEAVEIALASNAFKKAVGYAKRVLARDPINQPVRAALGQAHLAHARKQIKAGNTAGAHQELEQAALWLTSARDRGVIQLLTGLANSEHDTVLLRTAVADLGGSLVGGVLLALEARRVGAHPNTVLKQCAIDLTAKIQSEHIIAFAQMLNTLPTDDKALVSALTPFIAMIKRATGVSWTEPDLILVCEALCRCGMSELTQHYANAALKRWPHRPVFVFLKMSARYGSKPWTLPERECAALEEAAYRARQQGDERTLQRISALLTAATEYGDAEDDEDDEIDFYDDIDISNDELQFETRCLVLEAVLFTHGQAAFLHNARRLLGDAEVDALKRQAGGSGKKLVKLLIPILARLNLDLFNDIPSIPSAPRAPDANESKQRTLFDE